MTTTTTGAPVTGAPDLASYYVNASAKEALAALEAKS